ncbi:hypothetical protein CLV34_1597 [Luteimicrobium subarcticum]|uniref:Glycosyl transferase family 92 n=1 Tax=Luteimicrobium subarcticum TaxID=620910 RepID=A0A2M8WT33_9MICO|nr:hypothetical protein CLV34_1597 [Luteimicrobium subarcticum]
MIATSPHRRVPPRPPERQEAGYLEKFDDSTVFYDVFRCGRKVLAVGPPAHGLESVVDDAVVTPAFGSKGSGVHFASEKGLDRLGRFWASSPRSDGPLRIRAGAGPDDIEVGADLAGAFAGRRAVMTLSKDNDLEWIRYWAGWYAQRHGADALVVYDNGSTAYSTGDLVETLAGTVGVAVAAVVEWPFTYGPQGFEPYRTWDSNYAQHGALEHARWRLLRRAAGMVNADIDELMLDPEGRSVFDATTASRSGALSVPSTLLHPAPGAVLGRPRHSDSYFERVEREPTDPKWCVVPSRLPAVAQLGIHGVVGVRMDRAPGFRLGHFYAITTNWATGDRIAAHADLSSSKVDTEFRSRFAGEVASVGVAEPASQRLSARVSRTASRAASAARERVKRSTFGAALRRRR